MDYTGQLFTMAIVWMLVAAVSAYFVPKWWLKGAFLLLAVGIPFWELPYGYYNFRKLCGEAASLQTLSKIPAQDSVCIEYFDLRLYQLLESSGFTRIEVTGKSENAKPYVASGRVYLVDRKQVQSEYCVIFRNNIAQPWRILRADTLLVRAVDGSTAARQSYFRWDGMWWQEAARPLLGIGGACSGDLKATVMALRQGSS